MEFKTRLTLAMSHLIDDLAILSIGSWTLMDTLSIFVLSLSYKSIICPILVYTSKYNDLFTSVQSERVNSGDFLLSATYFSRMSSSWETNRATRRPSAVSSFCLKSARTRSGYSARAAKEETIQPENRSGWFLTAIEWNGMKWMWVHSKPVLKQESKNKGKEIRIFTFERMRFPSSGLVR